MLCPDKASRGVPLSHASHACIDPPGDGKGCGGDEGHPLCEALCQPGAVPAAGLRCRRAHVLPAALACLCAPALLHPVQAARALAVLQVKLVVLAPLPLSDC